MTKINWNSFLRYSSEDSSSSKNTFFDEIKQIQKIDFLEYTLGNDIYFW